MTKNEGTLDRIVRVIIGASLAILFFAGILSGALGYTAVILGTVLLITGITGFCGIYTLFGINTCSIDGNKK
ncbi:MAG TPA: DUF2892 domain-containing protein [Flavobacteriales bacterium]|jgi:hypothetical protein|nr:DUF2892 domain-containing protein [Flavobacteriales bacterium]